MKKTHICPKCGDNEIVIVPGKIGAYGSGNNIRVGWTIYSAVLVHRYVCCSCGYTEEWINEEDLSTIKWKYPKYF